MPHEIIQQVDAICKRMFELHGAILEELGTKILDLSEQLTFQRGFDEISSLIRENKPLPIRRVGYNIKYLLREQSGERWSRLLKLDFRPLIFCILSAQTLVSIPVKRFNWLADNVQRYLQAQSLPPDWIVTDQIRKALANAPKQENTQVFWKNYHRLELEHHKLKLERGMNAYDPEDQTHIQSTPKISRAKETPQGLHILEVPKEIGNAPETGSTVERKRNRSEPDLAAPSPKHARLALQNVPGNSKPLDENYFFSFSFVKYERLENLPEFFLGGMKMSRSWKKEMDGGGGLGIMNCLSLHIPKIVNEDAIFQIKIDYHSGWRLLHLLGLGDITVP